jgi:hypothetical protein
MKKLITNLILLLTIFQLASCATTADMHAAKTCKVWEDQAVVGPFHIDVNDKMADWEGRCTVLYFFRCFWVKSDIEGIAIYQDSNGIFNSRTKIANFKNDTVTYDSHFLDSIMFISPFKIVKKNKRVRVNTTAKGLGQSLSAQRFIHFNEACTEKQIAMGAVTLITAKNK